MSLLERFFATLRMTKKVTLNEVKGLLKMTLEILRYAQNDTKLVFILTSNGVVLTPPYWLHIKIVLPDKL